ncbi:hypothetical protein [Nitrospirillum viridazoti]|nr:hypothetical protein [Nitrospirillum amazonense]
MFLILIHADGAAQHHQQVGIGDGRVVQVVHRRLAIPDIPAAGGQHGRQ